MSRYLLTLGLLIGAADTEVFGQTLPSIQTDRPDQTECPFTVPKNHFQMENGFSFEHTNSKTKTFFHPSALSKYGVNDHLELRLITEFTTIDSDEHSLTGLNPVTIGFKTNLCQEK